MPKSLNRVQLIGNLGKEPEVKHTKSGTAVARVSLATNERFKSGDEWKERTEWHVVILWARLAEIAGEYLRKGSKVFCEGRMQTRSWDDNGTKRYATEVICTDLIMLDSREKTESAKAENTGPITDEDIPF